jgi:hypothetical protein
VFFSFGIDQRPSSSSGRKIATPTNKRNDSEMKEISAQKLCAGTVSGATHKAGGLYEGLSERYTLACEAASFTSF